MASMAPLVAIHAYREILPMLIRARTLLTGEGSVVEDGAVRVEDAVIQELGPGLAKRAGEAVVDLGESILLPGLLNAHCHLDYTSMRNAIAPPRSFTAWVQKLNSIKRQLSASDVLESIVRGADEARRFGTTTVCSMAAFPELMHQLPALPIRVWWFYEMIDIRHRNTSEDVVAGALSFFEKQTDPLANRGLNPHAPYTASLLLYRLAHACASAQGMLLTTHVAESHEESEMFRQANGPLYDFLQGLERPMHDCGHDTPFGWLWRNSAIGPDWILAHLNELEGSDFSLLETIGREKFPHVVHCPGSHRYFGHRPFPFAKLAGLGMNICIGTDSLASTQSLSLLEELRLLADKEPGLTPEDLLYTVTGAPARALRMAGELGCIRPGALADLIAIPFSGPPRKAAEAVIAHRAWISWMMVHGKPVESI
jgi:cytosine/adenosine deaminase-related metal-dependent hydrolase